MAVNRDESQALVLLRHLASWGLPVGPNEPIQLTTSWPELSTAARGHRISGIVLDAIDDGALRDAPDERARRTLAADHLELLQQSLLAEADLIRVTRVLQRVGIEYRVLKGLATAHLDHHDPSQRITSDADVLVRADQLRAASDALHDVTDHVGTVPDRRAGHVDRYGKDRTLRLVGGGWLDLHRMIAPAYWGLRLDHEVLFGGADVFEVAGCDLSALSIEHRFVHAILHAGYSDDIKIQSFRDIALIAPRLQRDPAVVLEEPWLRPVRGLLVRGVQRFAAVLDVDQAWTGWADTVVPDRRERLALKTLALPGSRVHWSGPLALTPWRWPGYMAPIVAPSRRYLDHYGRRRRDHLTIGRQALRRRRDNS